MSELPYAGVRVVELGSRIATGACGRLLADLGALVCVVESRGRGDALRRAGKWVDRVTAVAGKQSLLFEAGNPADEDALLRSIEASDVVLLSSDADEALCNRLRDAIAARPVICDITAFGTSGPLAGRYAEEAEVQALTGVMETTGPEHGPAVAVGAPVIEMQAGMYAAAAVGIALHVLRRDKVGQHIEIALFDVGVNALTTFLPAHCAGVAPRRLGNGHGMAVPWNAYPTADGWVLICSTNDIQWRKISGLISPDLARNSRYESLRSRVEHRAEVDACVTAWTKGLKLAAVMDMLNGQGVPCGSIVPLDSLHDEPNLVFRATIARVAAADQGKLARVPNALIRFDGEAPSEIKIPQPDSARSELDITTTSAATRAASVRQQAALPAPFAGLRVVEIGQLTTAPLAAKHLASFGADVIKVEPLEGESARAWPPAQDGVSHFFVLSNGEKRSLALDLGSPEGAQQLATLLADADVLVENMKPGALARLGFDQQRLDALNPRLIYCAISGFGIHSVYKGRPAVDTVVQAMSGMMDATRFNGMPLKTGISTADIGGGEIGLTAIIAALALRERTGRGCSIDISMQDVGAWITQSVWNGSPSAEDNKTKPLSIAEVFSHPQTTARQLVMQRQDTEGRRWEIFGSPMRLSRTPAVVGTLIGPPARKAIAWRAQDREG
ncbi:CaiB/BaiF CoA transferase family protein [Lacisediminimonas profundi]|uniref:CaiB/BaiF CoA transferase family protein n=1 Tax=Lacisediminimonas profundi TaxID=2603856 RepID=UPI00124BB148|nr:CoA transferase [Lacisediminimonas profundi]